MIKLSSNKNIRISLIFIVFVISRIFFINTQGVFFDSKEYFNLLSNPNYIIGIASGHYPPHEGYIILFWPIFHFIQLLHGDGSYGVILMQIIFSFITLYFFYKVTEYVTDKRVALFAAIIASITPLFWVINVTLMMENAYAIYFFTSLYLLTLFLKRNKTIFLLLSLIFYGMAIITQAFVGLWAPVYLTLIFIKNKHLVLKAFLLMVLYFSIFSIVNILFLSLISHMNIQTTFFEYYLSKTHEFTTIYFNLSSLLVSTRNFLIPLFRNNTILLILLSFISLLILLKKNWKLFIFGFLWIFPAFYTNQWWDSLLNGRHALLTGFGVAFLTAYLVRNKPIIFGLIVIYILFGSLPALNLLRYPIPYLQEADFVKTLPKNDLLIESHFARPQVQDTAKGKTLYVNEPDWSEVKFKKDVDEYLVNKRPVFISGAALSEPYGLFSGPYVHNITLSYKYPFELIPDITPYTLKRYKIINSDDNLIIYQIISHNKSHYPPIKYLQNSPRRIDYTDPLSWIVRSIESTFFHQ